MVAHLVDVLQTSNHSKPTQNNRRVMFRRGATIHEITSCIKNLRFREGEGILVIQGGGNNLQRIGAEETWAP